MIVKIVTKEARSHLVSIIKIPEEEDAADSESESPWYLFNDFAVRSISEGEALSFAGDWKVSFDPIVSKFIADMATRSPPSCISSALTHVVDLTSATCPKR